MEFARWLDNTFPPKERPGPFFVLSLAGCSVLCVCLHRPWMSLVHFHFGQTTTEGYILQ